MKSCRQGKPGFAAMRSRGRTTEFKRCVSGDRFSWLLDFTVHELSIEVPSQVGVAITQDQAPEFHRLATEILKLHDSESNPTEAHFIRTSDYYTFEIARGNLGKDFITMMLHRDQ